jgi:hypothetical protein
MTALISAAGAFLVAVAGYLFSKHAEREAAWRSEKLTHYKALLASRNGIFEGQSTEEGQRAFAHACNDILLFAPKSVIDALFRYQEESRASNPQKTQQSHDNRLSDLLLAIRRDLRVSPADNPVNFRVRLWVPGPLPHLEDTHLTVKR